VSSLRTDFCQSVQIQTDVGFRYGRMIMIVKGKAGRKQEKRKTERRGSRKG
jgi:hypothetical protein